MMGTRDPKVNRLRGCPMRGINMPDSERGGWRMRGRGVIMTMEANLKIKIQVKLSSRVFPLLIYDQDESQVRYGASWRFFFLRHPRSQDRTYAGVRY